MNRRSFLVKGFCLTIVGCALFPGCVGKVEAKSKKYRIDPDQCNGCGKCLRACEASAIKFNNDIATIDPGRCNGCGHCTEYCRREAIVLSTQ